MPGAVSTITILGSTGSIGRSTLRVVAASEGRFRVHALTAHGQLTELVEQARQFRPSYVVATDEDRGRPFDWSGLPSGCQVLFGQEGLEQVATAGETETVVAAIVGAAGLRGAWAALGAGKRLALANKETLVVAGGLAIQHARANKSEILPVDSEHSAVFQALQAGRREEVERIILTASGGPFRDRTRTELQNVTVEQALEHPTWNMGAKITVDSATMMNKALEIIEARWLFDMPADAIDVVIHPQSVVHSMVEFADGSLLAQLSPPDMMLPIQYALTYPDRKPCPAPRLDLAQAVSLDFEPPDRERFPALELGYQVARDGGGAGAVLNAANEAAVARFLAGDLRFVDIPRVCGQVLAAHDHDSRPTLERLFELDAWAREEVMRWTS